MRPRQKEVKRMRQWPSLSVPGCILKVDSEKGIQDDVKVPGLVASKHCCHLRGGRREEEEERRSRYGGVEIYLGFTPV